MKSTEQYLDEVKDRLELPSDYAIAKALGVTRAAISSYRTGRSMPDDLVCARIADALCIEPMEVIAAINYQRSKTDDARRLWEGIWGKVVGAIALNLIVCAVGLSVAPITKAAESGNTVISLYYVKSLIQPRHGEAGLKLFRQVDPYGPIDDRIPQAIRTGAPPNSRTVHDLPNSLTTQTATCYRARRPAWTA